MSRRKFEKRFNRNISTTGNSFCVTIHQEHIDELKWKKGKEVKTAVVDGRLVVCDSKMKPIESNDKNAETIKALQSEIEALYREKEHMQAEIDKLKK